MGLFDWLFRSSKHKDEPKPDVPFSRTDFRIPAGQSYRLRLNVQTGWFIEYRFTSNLDIDFSILNPRGVTMLMSDKLLGDKDTVQATSSGVHTMLFDNEKSLVAAKQVKCEYRVVR